MRIARWPAIMSIHGVGVEKAQSSTRSSTQSRNVMLSIPACDGSGDLGSYRGVSRPNWWSRREAVSSRRVGTETRGRVRLDLGLACCASTMNLTSSVFEAYQGL